MFVCTVGGGSEKEKKMYNIEKWKYNMWHTENM